MANVSGTAELDLLPSNLCNKASGTAQTAVEHHSVDECENAELVSCHEISKIARKRSRSHGIETAKSPNDDNKKKVRNHGSRIRSMTEKLSSSVSVNETNQGLCGTYEKKQIKDSSFTFVKRKNYNSATFLAEVPATSICEDKNFINCQLNMYLHGIFNFFVHSSEKATCVHEEDADSESTQVAHNVSIDDKLVRLYSFYSQLACFLVCFY